MIAGFYILFFIGCALLGFYAGAALAELTPSAFEKRRLRKRVKDMQRSMQQLQQQQQQRQQEWTK